VEWRYSSTHSLTSALDSVSDELHAPVLYPQRKRPWYPLDRRLCGPQSRSGRGGEKFPAPAGNRILEPRSSIPLPRANQTEINRPLINHYQLIVHDHHSISSIQFCNLITEYSAHMFGSQRMISFIQLVILYDFSVMFDPFKNSE
jgi:hypothetical protein